MSGISPPPPAKDGSSKKREIGARIETQKEVKPHLKSSMFQKKERIRCTSYWDRFYQKKERKEITFSYSAKSDVWPHPYPHIICICATFYSLAFPFLTPFHYTILYRP
jgi:hypothetical protein